MLKIAILDDYQRVAFDMADWSALRARCQVDVFDRPLGTGEEAAEILRPYGVLCHLRERMAMPAGLIERLPNLKLLAITGKQHRSLDMAAATARGILVSYTEAPQDSYHGTPELTWGLILSLARQIPQEHARMREGEWQSTVGFQVFGKTLGLVGLGRIGGLVAKLGRAFGVELIAWSQNMTADAAAAHGARLVSKDELFRQSDIVSLHVVLSDRTRDLVGARELGLMKPTAYLVNTSRGPLVDEAALLDCLRARRIAGAALDVYHEEPLPPRHPIRSMDNVVLSPHLGYVTKEGYRVFYGETVENVTAFLEGKPIRVANPEVLAQ
jgi:phosphoglycerate dehydrogenase-like enzyme